MLKIASWNVNSLRVRLEQVLQWLAVKQPDLVGLQETKLTDDSVPIEVLNEAGYKVIFAGQKTYNGVAVLSRRSARDIVTSIPGFDDEQRRFIGASYGDVRLLNVYVPNGERVGSDKFQYKLRWLEALSAYLELQLAAHPRLVVVGDFNIAPDDRDVYDPQAWQGQVLCSEEERDALSGLCNLGLSDTFRLFEREDGFFSWWDYRMAAFRRNMGLRIDLILSSAAMSEACRASYVDKGPRGWVRPSDHAPVIAEFKI